MIYDAIIEKIKLGNNGKMLLCNFDKEEKKLLAEMRTLNIVAPASFYSFGDSVKLHYSFAGQKDIFS